jgi:hypothetical protein
MMTIERKHKPTGIRRPPPPPAPPRKRPPYDTGEERGDPADENGWEVIEADPDGFWLVPPGSTDPDDWAWMEQDDPADEIERLRGRIGGLETSYNRLHGEGIALRAELAEKDKRVEGLEAELDDAAEATGIAGVDKPMSLLECIQALRASIEELEDASVKEVLDFGVEQLSRGHDKYSLITEEQIDHAWSFRETDPNGCIDAALSCFDILPCDGCADSLAGPGTVFKMDVGHIGGHVPCPTCHRNGKSHGWMWKEVE